MLIGKGKYTEGSLSTMYKVSRKANKTKSAKIIYIHNHLKGYTKTSGGGKI